MEVYQEQLDSFMRAFFIGVFAIITFVLSLVAIPGSMASAATPTQKVEVVYFWGAECPHCHNLKPWLDEFEESHKDTLKVNRYEFWHNEVNAQFFMNTMAIYHVPENQAGAPAMVVNNKVLIGTKNIQEHFEEEYKAALEKLNSKKSENEGFLTGGDDLGEKVSKTANNAKDLGAITATALADSINPCAMAVLVILLSSLVVMQKNKSRIAMTAISFITASYIVYFLVGLGLTHAISVAGVSEKVIIAVGAIALIVGLAEMKDAFFYQKGGWSTEIPARWREKLSKLILSVSSPAGAFVVGAAVTLFELPCTGGPYLFGLSLISQHSIVMKILLLAYYNLIFVLPLIVISLVVVLSSKSAERVEAIEHFRNSHVKEMHFIVGIIMLVMGVWALFIR